MVVADIALNKTRETALSKNQGSVAGCLTEGRFSNRVVAVNANKKGIYLKTELGEKAPSSTPAPVAQVKRVKSLPSLVLSHLLSAVLDYTKPQRLNMVPVEDGRRREGYGQCLRFGWANDGSNIRGLVFVCARRWVAVGL